jgi:hypothetical protein
MTLQIGSPTCTHLLTTHLPQVAQAFTEQHSILIPPLEETDALALLACFIPQLVQQDPKRSQTLVRALNCLPLALTLMGKYLASHTLAGQPQSLQTILTHLHKTEQRVCVSRASIPEELSLSLVDTMPLSLHATIAMCDQYLSTQAHSALCSLSIFASKPDSFSKEAALAISQQSAETLDELLHAGLLENWGPEHYTLHQTIADYIQAQPKTLARHQPLSHAVVEDIKLDPPSPLSSTDPLFSLQPLQNIARDHRNNEPTVQPSHRLLQFPALIVSILFLCVFLITGLFIINKLPFSNNTVSTTYSHTAVIDDSTQGIGTNEINYPSPQTNDKGFTFNFSIRGAISNQDGWCTPGSDSKTFNCTLDFDKKQIALSTSAGDGSDMTHGSSYPLYGQQLPYCWPSWFPDNPNGKNDLYTYYCGFFK